MQHSTDNTKHRSGNRRGPNTSNVSRSRFPNPDGTFGSPRSRWSCSSGNSGKWSYSRGPSAVSSSDHRTVHASADNHLRLPPPHLGLQPPHLGPPLPTHLGALPPPLPHLGLPPLPPPHLVPPHLGHLPPPPLGPLPPPPLGPLSSPTVRFPPPSNLQLAPPPNLRLPPPHHLRLPPPSPIGPLLVPSHPQSLPIPPPHSTSSQSVFSGPLTPSQPNLLPLPPNQGPPPSSLQLGLPPVPSHLPPQSSPGHMWHIGHEQSSLVQWATQAPCVQSDYQHMSSASCSVKSQVCDWANQTSLASVVSQSTVTQSSRKCEEMNLLSDTHSASLTVKTQLFSIPRTDSLPAEQSSCKREFSPFPSDRATYHKRDTGSKKGSVHGHIHSKQHHSQNEENRRSHYKSSSEPHSKHRSRSTHDHRNNVALSSKETSHRSSSSSSRSSKIEHRSHSEGPSRKSSLSRDNEQSSLKNAFSLDKSVRSHARPHNTTLLHNRERPHLVKKHGGSSSLESTSKGKKRKYEVSHADTVESNSSSKNASAKKLRKSEPAKSCNSNKQPKTGTTKIENEESLEDDTSLWTRCSPADLYYQHCTMNPQIVTATSKLIMLLDRFEDELVKRAAKSRGNNINCDLPSKIKLVPQYPASLSSSSGSDSDSSETMPDEDDDDDDDAAMKELERKRQHPDRLHPELWFNESGEVNDGPLCKCSLKARRIGIRHGIYPGEEHLPRCELYTNNADRLYHYRITMSPHINYLTKAPTVIVHDEHEFVFEGFSMFSHYPVPKLPNCKVIRFNIEYTIFYIKEKMPENFTIRGIELFCDYVFKEVLELVDLDLRADGDTQGCSRFHFLPRFVRGLEDNGKEILSMNEVLLYLLSSSKPLVEESDIPKLMKMNEYEWQKFADKVKGMIVSYPGKKPCSLRVDQLDRDVPESDNPRYPDIVHFGIRPLQLSYAGNPAYQKAWREYVKYRHLLANKPKVYYQDRHKLMQKEERLQEMRTKSSLKRDVTVVVSSKGFCRTGIMCDIVQHAMLLPVLVGHLRFHKSLDILEQHIQHQFTERYLLQLAFTHPSFRENFGTNPDHARNSLTNCGIRQPEYGDRRIHYVHTRKRGINTLINIMSRFGKKKETLSNINHNERLEFLGDAVVEFLTSIHLFHLFPDIEEGGLATYRAAIVQNQHLAVLAKKLELDRYMLYAHGSDLCHNLELRHAMANCFEALMGALFLDGGVEVADRVFSQTLFTQNDLLDVWVNYPPHPIQEQAPDGDRHFIDTIPLLKKLKPFEEQIGVEFKHIRLLARAFTHRSRGYNHLTLGSNQRLEFLGDTVLQLVASEYLYKFFPEHHEGHLSLLRSSLVNNRTQSVVCDDLGMVDYANHAYPTGELRNKDRADLLEAFIGALYVDKGVEYCRVFCEVCFFPRLQDFIMNQDWNDPKSKLQQCCLTLRTMDGGEPDIPIYKVIECLGPTNTRIFTVAVYFRGERLAKGSGHSIQRAEMAAASNVLKSSKAKLFPQLKHQRRVIERSIRQHDMMRNNVKKENCSPAL